ncbi:hypothetical protein [Streptoalloteichus hindustanus]|uniref:Uncharacterized protein n=1 Tax=Streptoalloteichus hindustanus TaxID=2017 RepID=A0A1M5GNM1_STRHI|nr:hypothetical protein [Streptoalloteichus hindustanus]SHG05325.1 hypothetical protein SAMN05444320_106196 [Streptoalloteichus hindustanus]
MWNFLRRRRAEPEPEPEPTVDPVAAAERFWRRWDAMLPLVSSALGDGEPHRVENELCELVAELHPDLHFALERGQRSVYAFVVSGQGDPALRPFTDAWMAAAPAPDPTWEFHDAVPPVPDPAEVTVNIGAHRLPLAEVRVAALVDERARLVDVAVHHPGLAALNERSREAMTFLPLDATLGERLAADRLGRVETASAEPANAITLGELRTLVRELDERWRAEGGPEDGPEELGHPSAPAP